MKFTVKREDLERELHILQGIAEKKKTIPILSNILLTGDGNGLQMAATDLEVGLTTKCEAKVEVEGGVTASSKKLFEVVRSLSAEQIEIETTAGDWLNLRSGTAFFKLVGLPVNDFPEIPTFDFDGKRVLSHDGFKELIRRTLFAVTKEDVRYSLNGALLEIGYEKLRMVATDAHRLALVEQENKDLGGDMRVRAIIPKKALAELRSLANGEEMLFGQDEHHLYFKLGHRVLVTRVIEGQFPAYEKVVPKDNPERVVFSAGVMSEAIRRVSLLASERSRAIKITFVGDEATVTSSNPEIGEAEERVPVEYAGEELTISFNAQYILDFLAVADSEKVAFDVKDDSSQGVLLPLEEEQTTMYRYVVMPMRL